MYSLAPGLKTDMGALCSQDWNDGLMLFGATSKRSQSLLLAVACTPSSEASSYEVSGTFCHGRVRRQELSLPTKVSKPKGPPPHSLPHPLAGWLAAVAPPSNMAPAREGPLAQVCGVGVDIVQAALQNPGRGREPACPPARAAAPGRVA